MAGSDDEMLSISILTSANPVQSILPFIGVLTEYAKELKSFSNSRRNPSSCSERYPDFESKTTFPE
jgi:hypothetical protein